MTFVLTRSTASLPGPTTSARANNRPTTSNYAEPSLDSEHSDSSEYSDWAEEDGKKTLKPPPRKAQRAAQRTATQPQQQAAQRSSRSGRSQRRNRLQIQEDDDEELDRVEVCCVLDWLGLNSQ